MSERGSTITPSRTAMRTITDPLRAEVPTVRVTRKPVELAALAVLLAGLFAVAAPTLVFVRARAGAPNKDRTVRSYSSPDCGCFGSNGPKHAHWPAGPQRGKPGPCWLFS